MIKIDNRKFELEFMKLCIMRYLRYRGFPYIFSETHNGINSNIEAYNKNYSHYKFLVLSEESEILHFFRNTYFFSDENTKRTNFIYIVVPKRLSRLMELMLRRDKTYSKIGIMEADVSVSDKTYDKKAFSRIKTIKMAEFIPYDRAKPDISRIMGRIMKELVYFQKRYIEDIFHMQIDSYDLNIKRKKFPKKKRGK